MLARWCVAAGALSCLPAVAQQITLTADRIDGPSFSARGITAVLRGVEPSALELKIAEATVGGVGWRNARITCPRIEQERNDLVCADGALEFPARTPLTLRYSTRTHDIDVALKPAPREEWRLKVGTRGAVRDFALTVSNGLLTRFATWWPKEWPKPSAGTVSGSVTLSGDANARARGELSIAGFGFSDASGLHAGEKIAATLALEAEQRGAQWHWQAKLSWLGGDVLWQPLFVGGGGHALSAAGVLDPRSVALERGRLSLVGIGDLDFNARFDRETSKLATASLNAANLEVAALYEKLLKPALQGTALGDLRCDGRVDVSVQLVDGAPISGQVALARVSVEDKARRFALFGLSGSIPWHREQLTAAKLRLDGGELLHVPYGAFDLPLELRGIRVRARDIQIPVLDGKLLVNDFATSGERESWRWRFSGALAPISMQQLTAALGLPVMHGTLSAAIPTVTYQASTVRATGALLFNVFDGSIVAQNLVLENPVGRVPRLTADVDMRNLDLDLLTRTFSFGNITGRIDAQIHALELVSWQPVRFDARVASSAGDYPRRISQAAVQNISALGGAGAAAAIQRSFLRFFEQFGYSAIGLSCKLELGVCRMGGIEDVPQGYVIVKGGGIPAINVLGYNRSVGWHELIERLKRVTQGNVIVK